MTKNQTVKKQNPTTRQPIHEPEHMERPVISVQDAAERWGISVRRANRLCNDGRIVGAYKLTPRMWVIPANAEKPADGRLTPKKKTSKGGSKK